MKRNEMGVGLALTLALCTVTAASAQPKPPGFGEDHPVSVVDPNLPASLHPGLRRQFLNELERAASSLVRDVRVITSEATETLMVFGPPEQVERIRKLTEQLRKQLVAREARDRAEPSNREGQPVRTVVQVVLASSEAGKPAHPLAPKLAEPLAKAMGYRRFDVVGHAMAEGTVGEETKVFARMPWPGGYPVGLQAVLVPFADDNGVRIRAEFGVHSEVEEKKKIIKEIEIIREEGEDEEEDLRRRHVEEEEEEEYEAPDIVEGSVETTYRPKAGKPLVVGATPMGGGRSLLFVVTHTGEGVE